MQKLLNAVGETCYPGRGIIIGKTADGTKAVMVYFIMGRSTNSRNRIFEKTPDGIKTKAFDEKLLKDPSLIIYSPVRKFKNSTIVTNGDQTDTIYEYLEKNNSFEAALRTRCFEPDAPNFTPRVSAIVQIEKSFNYSLSILKSADDKGSSCSRYFFEYEKPINGVGHFIHTYDDNGTPIPPFTGEPEEIEIPNDINEITNSVWQGLNDDNKVSLFVRTINLTDGTEETKIINKNK